jgi:cytidylate kinase
MTAERPVIAIDGPAGSGKSTLARGLARELGLPYVNTGLMYRALTRAAIDRDLRPSDADALLALLETIRFAVAPGDPPSLTIDGAPPAADLGAHDVEEVISEASKHPVVRERMRQLQRGLGATGAVMEGRDIGSVVFPDADVKIYLVASHDERAARRAEERGLPGGDHVSGALAARDEQDARTNPFVPAADAVVLDTSTLDAEQTLAAALEQISARLSDGDDR